MARAPIPTWCYALVVVRKGEKFLLIQESTPGEQWYLPAGRVEAGESFAVAAVREVLEEGGVPVRLTGVLRVEHSPTAAGARLRVVFVAEPTDDTPPKSEPDDESLRAEWVSLSELTNYELRGDDVPRYFRYIASGGAVYPLSVLATENAPVV